MEQLFNVTYTYHDQEEKLNIENEQVSAESIGAALNKIAEKLDLWMDVFKWSDYWVIGINIVPELH